MKSYTIQVTKTQLDIIADCVEDCHRYVAGQRQLHNTRFNTDALEQNGTELRKYNATQYLRDSYAIYRQIRRVDATERECGCINVYSYPTMPMKDTILPIIKEVE